MDDANVTGIPPLVSLSRTGTGAPPQVLILGTRGVPAAHGGFETFVAKLAPYLAELGWLVSVYCQVEVPTVTRRIVVDTWRGVERVHVHVARTGPLATLEYDLHCTLDARRRGGACLVLGYNSAVLLPLLRLAGLPVVTNMDGIEWRRAKWNWPVRGWFFVNEWIAAWSSNRLIGDHPAMIDHLARRRPRRSISMVPYGADPIFAADPAPLAAMALAPGRYLLAVARIEPENGTLELVRVFSARRRGMPLVVLGTLSDAVPYHRRVRAAAGPEVILPGPIYDSTTVHALRFHARAYLHGHRVGGTNPSLVEALWAGNAVVAHDNRFNRWTAGPDQFFYADEPGLDAHLATVIADDGAVAAAGAAARARAARDFGWADVLGAYRRELAALQPQQVFR